MAKSGKRGDQGVEALAQSPSHLLHRALQFALDLYAEEAGAGAPTQRQYAVLSAVAAQEGLTQTELVRATGIDRSTLADLIARMIGKGLLARERSSADARANAVRLTVDGLAALERARPRVVAADARILEALSKGKRSAFLDALNVLARAGGKVIAKAERAAETDSAEAKAEKRAQKADKKAGKKKAKKEAKAAKAKPQAEALVTP